MAVSKAAIIHNPFNTFTNYAYPRTMQDVFIWAEWFWNRNHKYRTAIQKIVTYFIAGLQVTSPSQTDKIDTDQLNYFKRLLQDTYDLLPLVVDVGQQLAAMGNVFISAQRVFARQLCCPQKNCSTVYDINRLKKGKDYEWHNGKFTGKCQRCGRTVQFLVVDRPAALPDGRCVRFICRAARDMNIDYNPLTQQYRFLYKLPDYVRKGIQAGQQIYLRTTPQLYIDAAIKGDYIQFDKTKFFFLRTSTLSQLDRLYQGWGVPLFMASFGNILRLAMLDRFNQVVAMEYIAPIRMLAPPPGALNAGADPNRTPISGFAFRDMMTKAVKTTTANPTTWVVAPFPVNYTKLGGQSQQMAPVQLMTWYEGQILSDMGIPQQFRQTSFKVVAQSMGLRVFQRLWVHFAKNMNKFVKWATDQIADAHKIQHLKCELDMTSFVQDDTNKQIRLQLMQGGIISKQEGLAPFGIDYKQDAKKQREQQMQQTQHDQQMQAQMQGGQMVSSVLPPAGSVGVRQAQAALQAAQQQAQQPGGAQMPQGGAMPGQPSSSPDMPYGTGNSQSATLQQLFNKAQSEADRIYQVGQQSGPAARKHQIALLRQNDKILHAQVMQILQLKDRQVSSQAVAQQKGTMR